MKMVGLSKQIDQWNSRGDLVDLLNKLIPKLQTKNVRVLTSDGTGNVKWISVEEHQR